MARNRVEVDRETKRGEILAAATLLFVADGFEATSMAALARAANVTSNTVYWYFADKDAVLVAVLAELLSTAPVVAHGDDRPLAETLFDLAAGFDRIDALLVAVHARAEVSPAVRDWHERFHAAADAWLLERARAHLALQPGRPVPGEEALATVPRIWSYAIEGMVAHRLPAAERRAVCETLVRQLDAL